MVVTVNRRHLTFCLLGDTLAAIGRGGNFRHFPSPSIRLNSGRMSAEPPHRPSAAEFRLSTALNALDLDNLGQFKFLNELF